MKKVKQTIKKTGKVIKYTNKLAIYKISHL